MRIRRCYAVMIEPRERVEFDLSTLFSGQTGVTQVIEWIALAAHLDNEVALTQEETSALAQISPERWIERNDIPEQASRDAVEALIGKGLLITDEGGGDDV